MTHPPRKKIVDDPTCFAMLRKSRNALIRFILLAGLAGTAAHTFYGFNLYTNLMDFETVCFLWCA
jgi:hypothetical protein